MFRKLLNNPAVQCAVNLEFSQPFFNLFQHPRMDQILHIHQIHIGMRPFSGKAFLHLYMGTAEPFADQGGIQLNGF